MESRAWLIAGVLAFLTPSFASGQTAARDTTGAPQDTTQASQPAGPPESRVGQSGSPMPVAPVAQTEPDYPRGRISGLAYADYYFNSDGNPSPRYDSSGADSNQAYINGKKNIGRNLQGFAFRRVYFQLDNDLSAKLSTRFRLEVDNSNLTSTGKLTVFLKNAYLQVKNLVPRGTGYFGLLSTPPIANSELLWGYRAIEKTIGDFRALFSSSDLGAELSGFADAKHRFGYNVMVGNGTGQAPENNRYKRVYVSVPVIPIQNLTIEPYWDYMGAPSDKELETYKILAGYEFKRAFIGVDVVEQIQHSAAGSTKPAGYSIFGRTTRGTKINAFARFDHWETDRGAASRVDQDFTIAGLDWIPMANLHVMPNFESMQYRSKGTAVAPPYDDFQWRITFWYTFSKP